MAKLGVMHGPVVDTVPTVDAQRKTFSRPLAEARRPKPHTVLELDHRVVDFDGSGEQSVSTGVGAIFTAAVRAGYIAAM